MRTNTRITPIYTYEGAKAQRINAELQLRRTVMSCLLWEKEFYEDGEAIAERIAKTIPLVSPEKVAGIAIECRERMKLRHTPLFIVREMARLETHKHLVAETLERVIQRPDELSEFLALYWKDGRQPLSAQVKKGLARAFCKFNGYQLAKYNRSRTVKLKDVLSLTHAKPKDAEQDAIWRRLLADELPAPDTWEVALGADKKETWERLITGNKLGALAFLRNLRNMKTAGVSERVIFAGLDRMKAERILPFQFIAAAKYAPQWEAQVEAVMLRCLEGKLPGKTALVVDGSGSMFNAPISARSEITRFEAAAALAILAREICEECVTVVFSSNAFLIPARRGFALRDALHAHAEQRSTYTQKGIALAAKQGYDRLILITDEQSHEAITNPLPGTEAYAINVASARNGISYKNSFTHIDGWSEAVLDFVVEAEGKRAKIALSGI